MGMENFKSITLTPEEEELYKKAVIANPELTKEQFKEIRSGIVKPVDIEVNTDKGSVVAEVGQDYFESKMER